MSVVLEAEVFHEIAGHAARAYPQECCGALVGLLDGQHRRISGAWPLVNAAATPEHRFAVYAAEYMRVEQRARESGVALMGFYHSHPDAPAAPSGADLAEAWPHFSYVIVSVDATTPVTVTCWRLRDDRSAFDSEEITWRPES